MDLSCVHVQNECSLSQTALKGGTWVQSNVQGSGSDQAGQCRLQCSISSNWSRWSKTKEKVESCVLTVCSQAVWKTKKNCNLAFCEKCELTESFSSSILHLSFCFGSCRWLLSYSETYCSAARLKHVSLTHKFPNTTGNLISTPDNGVPQSSVTN